MAGIFINYRREDTSGEAAHLAADLGEELGISRVFIDIDTIGPGVDFVQRIDSALTTVDVVLVLIGDRWLSVTDSEGKRRLDNEGDFVVMEIAKALQRTDVTVVPVLVEGATMPTEAQLPPAIKELARRNALELSARRWRYDLEQILALIDRGGIRAAIRRVPNWVKVSLPVVAGAAVAAAIAIGSGAGKDPSTTTTTSDRPILSPATVPPAVDVCQEPLLHGADGTVGPIACKNGDLNQLAWAELATGGYVTLALGPNATPIQVGNALCSDLQDRNSTIPNTQVVYDISTLYYGWNFGVDPIDFANPDC